jgi:hypothetical protein
VWPTRGLAEATSSSSSLSPCRRASAFAFAMEKVSRKVPPAAHDDDHAGARRSLEDELALPPP